jgi:hypothetical protein
VTQAIRRYDEEHIWRIFFQPFLGEAAALKAARNLAISTHVRMLKSLNQESSVVIDGIRGEAKELHVRDFE